MHIVCVFGFVHTQSPLVTYVPGCLAYQYTLKSDPYDYAVSTHPSLYPESDFGGREIEKNLEI